MCRNGADWNGSVRGFEDGVGSACGCKDAAWGGLGWGLTLPEEDKTPIHAAGIVTNANSTKVISPQETKSSPPSGKEWKANIIELC